MADSDDLDQLLDSALDDFTKLDLSSGRRLNGEREEKRTGEDNTSSSTSASTTSVQGLGLGMGLPDQRRGREKKGKQKTGPLKGMSHASEALEKLTQETREAVMGLGAAAGMGSAGVPGEGDLETEKMVEDFVKQFEQLSGGGSQDMESIVETMMQQLLSKEILYEPMREIGERYPKWLEEHKEGLNPEDYERYSRQHELIVTLNEVYEYDPNNFPKIVELMQKMQECGQPPSDIVHELAPDLDLNNLGGQLSPEMFENAAQCSIM